MHVRRACRAEFSLFLSENTGKLIHGKLILENSFSCTWTRPISGKLIHVNSKSTNSVFIIYRVMSQTYFWKTHPNMAQKFKIGDWMSFPQIGLGHDPMVHKTEWGTHEIFLVEFSRNSSNSWTGKWMRFPGWLFHGWVFQNLSMTVK